MSSGPKTVTSTTSSEPPSYLVPHIQGAAGAAGQAYNQLNSGNNYNPAATPSPFGHPTGLQRFNNTGGALGGSPAQREGQGLDALFNRGAAGSPVLGAANNLTQQTLQGDFLSPDSNPYLEQTFNRAADLTRGRLDSEFAGAGRNLGAARPARSDELQTLASNIYGQNFQAERDRMGQAVGQASGLQNSDFQNIQAMIDSGSFPLDQYINRLGGLIPGAGGVTQSQQPVFRTGLF